jgi:hypothetical protein
MISKISECRHYSSRHGEDQSAADDQNGGTVIMLKGSCYEEAVKKVPSKD